MKTKFRKFLLNRFQLTSKKRQKAGFTLLELLISTMIGAIIVTALLSFVVELLNSDRKDFANSETQREMQTALDFIADDLREGVYIYDNIEAPRKIDGKNVQPLKNYLPDFDNSYKPVLAFWKVERLPYEDPKEGKIKCSGAGECETIQMRRRSYTLVVYYQIENPDQDPKWKGKSRIVRYALRKYKDVNSLTYNPGYADPVGTDSKSLKSTTLARWPMDATDKSIASGGRPVIPPGGPPVLVDFVDAPTNVTPIQTNDEMKTCNSSKEYSPLYTAQGKTQEYKRVPSNPLASSSFFVCVKTVDATQDSGTNQDAIVYLRGNIEGKVASQKTNKSNPLITLTTQAFARGVINKGRESESDK